MFDFRNIQKGVESMSTIGVKIVDYLSSINNWLVSIEAQLEEANKHLSEMQQSSDAVSAPKQTLSINDPSDAAPEVYIPNHSPIEPD